MRECWDGLLAFFRIETGSGAYWALAFAAAVYLTGTTLAARKACGGVDDAAAPDDGGQQEIKGAFSDSGGAAGEDESGEYAGITGDDGGVGTGETAGVGATAKKRGSNMGRGVLVLLIWFVVFMNPLTAALLEKWSGNAYRYVYAALAVPVLPVIAYAAADIWNRQRRHAALTALFLAAAIAFAGTVYPFDEPGGTVKRSAQWDDAERGAMGAVLTEAERLRENGQVALLAAPKSMMEMARRYDAQILLAYGRNLWQTNALHYVQDGYMEEQVRLCLSMEAEPFQAQETAELALAYGCNLIVLKDSLSDNFLDNRGLSCVYESDRFFVYVR